MSTEELLASMLDKLLIFGLKLLAALLIYFVGIWIIRRIRKMLGTVFQRRQTDTAIASFVQSFASVALTIILIILVIGTLGIETTSLAALLAAGGVAIGMALSGTVQNFAGGIMLLIFKPFKAGDFIESQGVSGVVDEVNITATKIHTPDNKIIILPNGALSNAIINNYSQMQYRRVEWIVGLDYGCDSRKVKTILRDLLMEDDRILTIVQGAPADPLIELSALADSSVQFVMRAWVKSENYWPVTYAINEAIYEELPAHGVNFPFQQMDIHIK
ncbi:MAG: mechanosensitive ion channel [Bacteroidales bacterium]|nr:mechanosensitive ion channel [Bacteroidales bacterium]MBO5846021.1 mechanosensitive ion channel [Bacteroidales bacterium]MBO7182998.1 mechanosensitive ion channel [Bacteroidales bacterium]MBO7270826.1 mechanosensitive ion channel [Bacteroidales bacterium]